MILALVLSGCTQPRTPSGGGSGDKLDTFVGFSPDTAPKDNGGGDTGSDTGDVIVEPDVPGPPCESGACTDNNACTVNDQCVDGECKGTPVDCGDDVVCTDDACLDGSCVNAIADGFCLIDDVCYANADKNPKNACERCAEPSSKTAWSPVSGTCDDGDICTEDLCVNGACESTPILCPDDGNPCTINECVGGACEVKSAAGACEDGNPCTDGDACDKSVCVPGPAKVCPDDGDPCTTEACGASGCVSTPIPGCGDPPEDECTYHKECNPAGVCALHKATNLKKCSAPCAGVADCAAGEVCSKLPGAANIGYCEPQVPGGFGAGSNCATDAQCSTGTCAGSICVHTCLDQQHCTTPGHTCTLGDDTVNGILGSVCFPNQPGLLLNGQPCTTDNLNFGGSLCMSAHCNLLGPGPYACSAPCTSETDCPTGQECNLVVYSPTPNPSTTPFQAGFGQLLHDVFMGCYTQPPGGIKPDGSLCSTDTECASNKCLQLELDQPAKYCTTFCTNDSECPPTLKCKMDALSLTSTWLTSPEIVTQGPQPAASTYVRVCRLP